MAGRAAPSRLPGPARARALKAGFIIVHLIPHAMPTYDTLTEALNDLRQRGYGLDYNLTGAQACCDEAQEALGPDELTIKEVYRFEGDSNPDDNMVLYAIESRKTPTNKGVLVAAYGSDVETEAATFIQRLDIKLASG